MSKSSQSTTALPVLADRILMLRARLAMSQDTLAEVANVSRSALTFIEQGRQSNARLATLQKLADALQVDALAFFVPGDKSELARRGTDIEARLRENVRRLRQERGLSQEKLSIAAGRFRTYVGRVETGAARPEIADVVALANALEVSVQALLSDMNNAG